MEMINALLAECYRRVYGLEGLQCLVTIMGMSQRHLHKSDSAGFVVEVCREPAFQKGAHLVAGIRR